MNNQRISLMMAVLLGACLVSGLGQAQVVREDGASSIAGVLDTAKPQVSWTFRSAGSEILFASLDADIYRIMAAHEGETTAAAEPGGGCGGEDEGGPGLFKLKVLDSTGTVLCSASRPAPPPGWQRDPRLACELPVTKGQVEYTLRVELANPKGEQMQPSYPFLLNVSLRGIAPSGGNIQSAIAQSGNHF